MKRVNVMPTSFSTRMFRWGLAVGLTALAAPLAAEPMIVIVGGMKQGMPVGEHDYPDGALKLERIIKASPDFAKVGAVVKTYPTGFPKNLSELDKASVVVLYTGTHRQPAGGSLNPVQDPQVQAALGKLMAKGVGIVAMHQSFTVPADGKPSPFAEWLGAYRPAVSDYSYETAPVKVAAPGHPIASGVKPFEYLDEYYSAVDFGNARVTPVLTARAHVQLNRSGPVFQEPPKDIPIAWAYERPGGGRSFGFTGGHYLGFLDKPEVRKTVLNAILWTAKEQVPQSGATSVVPTVPVTAGATPPPAQRIVVPRAEAKDEPVPWGKLVWFAGRPLGNSEKMTTGQATIPPGTQNPPHWHPNTDEVLHVLQGHIMHRVGDKEYEMKAGDTVSIPEGTVHNARNIGTEDAILYVSFNSADRYSIGE